MPVAPRRAIHQSFLPVGAPRAFVWKYSERTGGRRPRHFHAEPELNVVVRGSATFGVGDRVLTVRAGELIAFPSAQDHVVLDSSPELYLYAIGLDADFSSEILGGQPSLPLHVRIGAHELDPLVDHAANLVDRTGAESAGAELWQRAHWLARHAAASRSPGPHVLTRLALQRLRSTPEVPLTALAQELRAHPTEISRHFHRDVGMTLVRYRTRLRLLQFIHRVDSGRTELMSAASHSGFGSYSQCHRAFQAELGCSPREFFSGLRDGMQSAYVDASLSVPLQ